MRVAIVSLLIAAGLLISAGMTASASGQGFDPKHTVGASVAYTDASSNIISGLSPDRRIFAVSVLYDRRLKRKPRFTYRWEVEVRPLVLIRNPRDVVDTTVNLNGLPATTFHSDTLVLTDCQSRSFTGTYYNLGLNGVLTPDGTFSSTQTCSREWVYSGGVSPLGQRFSFRPGRAVQPYAIANAGFVAAERAIPVSNATRFNFTAQLGAGVEWFVSPHSSFGLDLQYHHLSNGGRGDVNPSIETAMLKLSYRYGR